MATWLKDWQPENKDFWGPKEKRIAWTTLTITTISLMLSFATWFLMSAVVTKLPGLGFRFNTNQLFWLAALPGLAGGTFRLLHMFLIPLFGTRHTISFATLIKLLPVIALSLAVMNRETPFYIFVIIALTTGFGGGDFSSFMPSTSLFFPKRMIGMALGIQAGIGNFGVSIAQFMTPVMLSVAIIGGSQIFITVDKKVMTQSVSNLDSQLLEESFSKLDNTTKNTIAAYFTDPNASVGSYDPKKDELAKLFIKADNTTKVSALTRLEAPELAKTAKQLQIDGVKSKNIHLQSAILWYAPLLLLLAVLAWFLLKSVPMKATVSEQFDIFKNKHTWYCTLIYFLTFGTFSGLSASFPLLIRSLYGSFENAPDPLQYAFYGPLIGSASRVIFGFISDKTGGGILTTISGLGLLICTFLLIALGLVSPVSMQQFPLFVTVVLVMFFFTGIGNAATFRQFPIIFAHNSRQAAGVIGFTAAIAAYGPFVFSSLLGLVISLHTDAKAFFYGLFLFMLLATFINWNFYHRKGCEIPS